MSEIEKSNELNLGGELPNLENQQNFETVITEAKPKKTRGPYNTKKKRLAAMQGKGIVSDSTDVPITSEKVNPSGIGHIDLDAIEQEYHQNKDSKGDIGIIDNDGLPSESPNSVSHTEVSGKALVSMIDAVCPLILSFAIKKVTKGKKKVDVKDLRFTQDERDTLEPIADAAAGEIIGKMSPVQQLAIALLAIYAGKAIEHT